MKNKIGLIILLILIISSIIIFLCNSSNIKKEKNTIKDNSLVSVNKENINEKETEKLVIGDNYFITQINDIYYNSNEYVGRKIEIEGFPIVDQGYTFVGRYGPGCCNNDAMAYLEFNYDKEKLNLVNEEGWIKVVGTIQKLYDETTNEKYLCIVADIVEIMEERGIATVVN